MYRPAKEYEAPWWATILHSFPHLDLTFKTVNSSFNLDDPKYKEVIEIKVPSSDLFVSVEFFD